MYLTNIFFTIYAFISGFNWRKIKHTVASFPYLPQEKVKQIQTDQLLKLIHHAYHQVPFYTYWFDKHKITPADIKSIDDLKKIPVINKKVIAEHRDKTLAVNYKQFKPVARMTGGTTGLAFKFYVDRYTWLLNWAVKLRTFKEAGYNYGHDKLAVLAGGSLIPQNSKSWKKTVWHWIMNFYAFPISHMTDETMHKIYQTIKKERIKHLRGYPTAIYTFAKYLNEQNLNLPLKSIMTTAEMLHPFHREMFLKVYKCHTYDVYGAGDGSGQANDCELHLGMHLCNELSITEIINEQGSEVGNQEEGELVFTSLNDFAMPLIRYKPGDRAIKSTRLCSCGRTSPIIEKIIGRTSDLIELSNGRKLNGLSIPFEAWTEEIEQFQIVQTAKDALELNLIPKKSFTEKHKEEALELMKFHAGEGIKIQVNIVEHIALPKSGKLRYVISLVN